MRHIYLTEGAQKTRIDTDKKGVFVRTLSILDHRSDRILNIPSAQWSQYKDHAEVLGESLSHKIVSKPVVRQIEDVIDPDFDASEFRALTPA